MPNGSIAQESTAEHAALDIHIAVADFMMAIHDARTPDDALAIHRLASEARIAIEVIESAALNRADALCGGN